MIDHQNMPSFFCKNCQKRYRFANVPISVSGPKMVQKQIKCPNCHRVIDHIWAREGDPDPYAVM